jgi:hypothetical protein
MIGRRQGNWIGAAVAVVVVLVAVAPASAAPRISIHAKRVISFGKSTKVTGRLAGVTPNDGVRVDLQVKFYPYTDTFRTIASRKTDSTGGFSFTAKPDRNARYRVQARSGSPASAQVPIFVNAVPLTFITVKGATVMARMTFTFSPKLATSMFSGRALHWYFKPKSSKTFRRVRTNQTHRVRSGQVGGSLSYKIPKKNAREKFTIAWCFRPSKTGDVGIGDPKKSFKRCA